jgi:hypothetical protein
MTRAVLLAAVLAAIAVGGSTLSRPATAEGSGPVRSLLEMRRENVVIQKWDLSCGAAALDILLRYEHGDPVTEREIARGLIKRFGLLSCPSWPAPSPAQCALAFHPFEGRLPIIRIRPPDPLSYLSKTVA